MELTREDLKRWVAAEIDRRQDDIIALGERIWREPELGFKEHWTAQLAAAVFDRLGLPYRTGLALTGVKAVAAGRARRPPGAILGELDSILVADHPAANPQTGAAHGCGHNAQLANMLGAGIGLVGAGVLPEPSGQVVLFAVPAEEYVEIAYRAALREQGQLVSRGQKRTGPLGRV
jgi:metal-dependent amidase/aminoacylase/carboxypeptidase family protein